MVGALSFSSKLAQHMRASLLRDFIPTHDSQRLQCIEQPKPSVSVPLCMHASTVRPTKTTTSPCLFGGLRYMLRHHRVQDLEYSEFDLLVEFRTS